ncbi:MAG: bifunctional cysteine desulfurase / selenocysteine lyase SufS [Oceanicaulis sp. HLUCCA04]|nr:MAG: bifunctional cysteine desulfurase / selenocysteine lyase SufS [Oceanicaulis sp. HLUCCA04]
MTALARTLSGFDVNAVRAQFPILSRQVHGKPLVYLDSAASAQKPEAVINALGDVWRGSYANVHRGLHTLANEATEAFEATRGKLAAFLGAARSEEIVLTRGTTEAINLVASGIGLDLKEGDEIILSQMEHHSNIVPWHFLRERKGVVIKWVPVTDEGALDIEGYRAIFTPRTKMVALTHMSNVLGTLNDARALTEIAHRHGVPILLDGSQAAVHGPVDVAAIGCDFYAITGHKLYGPNATGALYAKGDWLERLPAFMGGGEMISEVSEDAVVYAAPPHKFEAGTPAIADVIALGTALDWMGAHATPEAIAHEHALMQTATDGLQAMDGIRILGTVPGKGPMVSFVVENAHAHDIAQLMDRYGLAVRAGHHCAHPLMKRFGVTASVRASFAVYNTADDVDAFLDALRRAREFLI